MKVDIQKCKNIAEVYKQAGKLFKDSPAFLTRRNGKYQALTYGALSKKGECLATALINLGINLHEHISILADNREEWIISEVGIKYAGCVDVPRGTDATDQDISYILSHADVKHVFVENETMLKRVKQLSSNLPQLESIIVMESGVKDVGSSFKGKVHNLYELIEKGEALRSKGDQNVEERISKIKGKDLFALIYTSGTTGNPKGVALTHDNIMSQMETCPIKFHQSDSLVTILPIWHIFERTVELISITRGSSTYYSNIKNLKEDLAEVRPTSMASAPRLWENIYQGIMKKVKTGSSVKRTLFHAAYFCSKRYKSALRFIFCREIDLVGRNPFVSLFIRVPFHLINIFVFLLPYLLLDLIVLSKIRKATGGRLRATLSGGGALPLHVDEFFNNIGIPVLEGYGMTETSPVLFSRLEKSIIMGTVGYPWPGLEMKLVDIQTGDVIYPPKIGVKGEIHVKGAQVMHGYHKDPEATKKILKDGWLNTGDLGLMTYNNCLKIVGRSKETIVLLGGENVEPTPIENKLLQSPMIEQCMVTGQDKKYLTCLIVPSLEFFSKFGSDLETLSKNKEVYHSMIQELKSIISSANGFKLFEKVVDCRLLPKAFTVGDELNNTFKLKRHTVTEKYATLIKSMYE